MTTTPASPLPRALVVCLCAQWCGSCRDYGSRFEQVSLKFPHAHFLWLDVEDEADLVDPVEVENFPTLLISMGDEPVFFGPLMPHAETLERLLQSLTDGSVSKPLADPDLVGLVSRILACGRIPA